MNIHSQPEIPYFPTWSLRQMLCLPIVIIFGTQSLAGVAADHTETAAPGGSGRL